MRTFLLDFGAGVAGVGRDCAELGSPDDIVRREITRIICASPPLSAAQRARIHGMIREQRIEMRLRLGIRQQEALNF